MTAKIISLETYRRERAIDQAITGLIQARAVHGIRELTDDEKIVQSYLDAINSPDPLRAFYDVPRREN